MSEPFAQYPGPHPVPEPPRRRGRHALGLTVTAVLALAGGAGAGVALSHGSAPSGSAPSASAPSGSATSTSNMAAQSQLASRVDPSLVDVAAPLAGQDSIDYGTGIVLTSTGEVLTNNHVIEGAESISVTDIGNGKTYKATVVGYDQSRDVAVLQLSGASGLTTAVTGDSSTVKDGDSELGIGNAGGTGGTPSAAAGTVTALNQTIKATDPGSGTTEHLTGLIETNADIQQGDSGGPLVNAHGQVIGMDTAVSPTFEFGSPFGGNGGGGNGSPGSGQAGSPQAYSIPINTALSTAREIEGSQASSTVHIGATAFLGLEIAPGQESSSGVELEGVASGTPAAAAGLGAGDVITSVAGQQVSSYTSIQQALEPYHPGDKIRIVWADTQGQSHTATLTLVNGPAA